MKFYIYLLNSEDGESLDLIQGKDASQTDRVVDLRS
jgi:hypothetical protein